MSYNGKNNSNNNSNWYLIYTGFNSVLCILWAHFKE